MFSLQFAYGMLVSVCVSVGNTEGSHSFVFELGLGQVFQPLVLSRGKVCEQRAAAHQLTKPVFSDVAHSTV